MCTMLSNHSIPLDLGSTIDSIILDLGDVLCTFSAPPKSPIDSKTLKYILNSNIYGTYQCGKISKEEAYSSLSKQFSVPVEMISVGLSMVADTLEMNTSLIAFLQDLRLRRGRDISFYVMSNISIPDWETVQSKMKPEDFKIFDKVFISAAAGQRKPYPGFYKHVIDAVKLNMQRTLFIDDKRENIATARTCGMHGMLWSSPNSLQKLKRLFNDPFESGMAYLRKNAKNLNSVTDGGVVLYENFSQLLILELLGDSSLVNIMYDDPWRMSFFQGKEILTTQDFPYDNDCMSISPGLRNLSMEVKQHIMNEMLQYRDEEGIILTYWDLTRPRLEPCCCVNALTLFYSNGRGKDLEATMAFIEEILINRGYIEGTYYYPSAEIFLYFLHRLLLASPEVFERLGPIFKERIVERFKTPSDTISLAMRVLVAARLFDLVDDHDVALLVNLEDSDGAWRNGCFYTYGIGSHRVENIGLTTSLALCAIKEVRRVRGRYT